MATISAATNEKVFQIKAWLGLNENPDGDTKLKVGEAAAMQNFRITRDGNLKRRPGTEAVAGLRIAYTPTTSDTEEIVCTVSETETIDYYELAVCNSLGLLALSNKLGSYTADEAAEQEVPIYFSDRKRIFRFSRAAASDGDRVIYGLRVTAEPLSGGVEPIAGLWSGMVGGKRTVLAACENRLWSLWDDTNSQWQKVSLGILNTSKGVHMFPFGGIVYILTGHEYMQFDGTTYSAVEGYRPLVALAISPLVDGEAGTAESGELNENINLLNGKRRAWLSPDGEGNSFQLPENGLLSIDYVKDLKTGNTVDPGQYTTNLQDGIISFSSVPSKAVNSLEVAWSMSTTYRSQVEHMRFSELYSGTQDTRVFLYGDGSNQAIYSGLDYDGTARADYFPDQSVVRVGDSNTPITGMIRHNSSLICFKTESAWAITFGITTLATDVYTPAFYTTPINRMVGNLAPGQVRLVNNDPVTCCWQNLYAWRGNKYGNLTSDERQAKVISARVQASVRDLYLPTVITWDDNDGQEYYVVGSRKTLVWNYAADAWTVYTGLSIRCMMNFDGAVYFGTADGHLMRFGENLPGDESEAIEATWESGSMSFGQDYTRKLSARLWLGLKPEGNSCVHISARTDRKDNFSEKIVSSDGAKVENSPFMTRCKMKAKKFVFYKLLLRSNEYGTPPTITASDIHVRYTGQAK